ncbi:MAG: hypothetical protein OXC46_11365 [Thaumarchaeota archaeon]|nr:hypothetical protein [Nitrososphaerota archaeon]
MKYKFIQKVDGAYHIIAEGEMTPRLRKSNLGPGDKIGRESVITINNARATTTHKEYAFVHYSQISDDGKEWIYEVGAFLPDLSDLPDLPEPVEPAPNAEVKQ